MNVIERHKVIIDSSYLDHDIKRNIEKFTTKHLPKLKTEPHKINIPYIGNKFYRFLSESNFLGYSKEIQFFFLYYAHQLGIAMFKLAANPGKDVVVKFGDTDVSAIGKETRDYVHPGYWTMVYQLTMILRDNEGYRFLKTVKKEMMLKAKLTANTYDIAEINLFKNLYNEKERIRLLFEAFKQADTPFYVKTGFISEETIINTLDEGRFNVIQLLFKPILYIYQKIFENDNIGLNKLIEDYLINYKKSIIKRERESDSYYWLAYPLLPALAFAHDQGMRIDVESDYIPAWLYKGEFEGLKGQLVC
jgi:hypothetical protein